MKLFNKIAVAALLALVAVSASAKGSSTPPTDTVLPVRPCMIAIEYAGGRKEYFNANLISKIGVYSYTNPLGREEHFSVSVNAGSTYRSFDLPNEAAAIKFADQIVATIEEKCK